MRKAIQLRVVLDDPALNRQCQTPAGLQEVTQQLTARLAAGGQQAGGLTFTLKKIEAAPTGVALTLWASGEAEPASDFLLLTTQAVRDILASKQTLTRHVAYDIRDIQEDRRDEDEAESEANKPSAAATTPPPKPASFAEQWRTWLKRRRT